MTVYYWAKTGNKFHSNFNCPALKASKEILSGSLLDAELLGHSVPCKSCSQNFQKPKTTSHKNDSNTINAGLSIARAVYGEALVTECYSFCEQLVTFAPENIAEKIVEKYYQNSTSDFLSCLHFLLSYIVDWNLPLLFSQVYKKLNQHTEKSNVPVNASIGAEGDIMPAVTSNDFCQAGRFEIDSNSVPASDKPTCNNLTDNKNTDIVLPVTLPIDNSVVLEIPVPGQKPPQKTNTDNEVKNNKLISLSDEIDPDSVIVYWSYNGDRYHAKKGCSKAYYNHGTIKEATNTFRLYPCQKCAAKYYKLGFIPPPKPEPDPFYIHLWSFCKRFALFLLRHVLFFVLLAFFYFGLVVRIKDSKDDYASSNLNYQKYNAFYANQEQNFFNSVLDSWQSLGTINYTVTPISKLSKNEDWDYFFYINDKLIKRGDSVLFSLGREYSFKAVAIEYDPSYDDIGEKAFVRQATSRLLQKMYTPGYSFSITTNTKETYGPAAGSTTEHRFDVTITLENRAPNKEIYYVNTDKGKTEMAKLKQLEKIKNEKKENWDSLVWFLKKLSVWVYSISSLIIELLYKAIRKLILNNIKPH